MAAWSARWEALASDEDALYHDVAVAVSGREVLGDLYPHIGHNLILTKDEDFGNAVASFMFMDDGHYRLWIRGSEDLTSEGDAETLVATLAEFIGGGR